MGLNQQDLQRITDTTIAHYEASAAQFWLGTRDHDVSQNMAALLGHIEGEAPYEILDFGCGPGRDLKAFTDMGHRATGLEGTPSFVLDGKRLDGVHSWDALRPVLERLD